MSHLPLFSIYSKTTSEEDSKQPAQAVTHVPAQPTYAPTWEERVTVEIDSIKAGEEGGTTLEDLRGLVGLNKIEGKVGGKGLT